MTIPLRCYAKLLAEFLGFVADDRLYAMWWLIALRGLRRGEAATRPEPLRPKRSRKQKGRKKARPHVTPSRRPKTK